MFAQSSAIASRVLCCAVLAGAPLFARAVETVRIGWQTSWATQGQVAQTLARTNALALHGLRGELRGFTYGPPLNEAALAGDVDVIFTSDQPAATLLARGGQWTIVSRLMYNRVAIYVPPDSPIRTVAGLKGKRIAMPYGAAAQRVALGAIVAAGLDPSRDIRSLHLDILEQQSLIQTGSRASWGTVDALVGFDPTAAILEKRGLARMLHVGQVVSVVLMSHSLVKRRDVAERFLAAFAHAWLFYATHQTEANGWFREASRLDVDSGVLGLAASIEPNIRARTLDALRLTFTEHDYAVMQSAADFLLSQKMTRVAVRMRAHVDTSLIRAALVRAARIPAARITTTGGTK